MKCNMNKESESDDDFMVDSIISNTFQRKFAPSLPDKDPEFPFLSQNELFSLKAPKQFLNHTSNSTPLSFSNAPTPSSSNIRPHNTPRLIRVKTQQNINSSSAKKRIIITGCKKSQDDLCLNKTTNNLSQASIIYNRKFCTIPKTITNNDPYHNFIKSQHQLTGQSPNFNDEIESSSVLNNSSILSQPTIDYSHSTANTNTDSDETHSIESSPEFLLCNDPIITAFVLDNEIKNQSSYTECNDKEIESDENSERNRNDYSIKSSNSMPCSNTNRNKKKTKCLKNNPMSFDFNNNSPNYLSNLAHNPSNNQAAQFVSGSEFISTSQCLSDVDNQFQSSKPYITTVGSVDDNLLMAMRRNEESQYNPTDSLNTMPVLKSTLSKQKNKKDRSNSVSKNKMRYTGHNKRIPKKMMNRIARNSHIIQQETDSNTTAVIKVSKSSLYRRSNSNNSSCGKKLKPLKPNYTNSLSQRKNPYKVSAPNDNSSSFQFQHISPLSIPQNYSKNTSSNNSNNSNKQKIILLSPSYTMYNNTNRTSSLHERNLNIHNSSMINSAGNISTNHHRQTGKNSDKNNTDVNVNYTQKKRKHLLQFIIDLLKEDHPCVEWFDKDDKEFTIVQPDALTKLWASYKHNDKMTFDSLARSLRLYYLPKKLERIQGKKNHYRLLPKAFAKSP